MMSTLDRDERVVETDENGDLTTTQMDTYWLLTRTGEVVMWGSGIIHLEKVGFEAAGYELKVTDDDGGFGYPEGLSQIGDAPRSYYALVEDFNESLMYGNNQRGFAYGVVHRKMVPDVSPDITAVELERAELPQGPVTAPAIDDEPPEEL